MQFIMSVNSLPPLLIKISLINCMQCENEVYLQFLLRDNYEKYSFRTGLNVEGIPKTFLRKSNPKIAEFQFFVQEVFGETEQFLRSEVNLRESLNHAISLTRSYIQLSQIYGPYVFKNTMAFHRRGKIYTWIHHDLLSNKPLISLSKSRESEIAMVYSIVTYFKTWLQCDLQQINSSKNIYELLENLCKLKEKKVEICSSPLIISSVKKVEFTSRRSHHGDETLRASSKCGSITLSEEYEKKVGAYKYQFKGLTSRKAESKNAGKNRKDKSSQNTNDFDGVSQTTNPKTGLNVVTKSIGQYKSNYSPYKSTSSTLKILKQIKKADLNPNQYTENKILLNQHQMERNNRKLKESLGQIGEELDNLFTSNIEDESQDSNGERERENQFNELLNL